MVSRTTKGYDSLDQFPGGFGPTLGSPNLVVGPELKLIIGSAPDQSQPFLQLRFVFCFCFFSLIVTARHVKCGELELSSKHLEFGPT